jgi:hypothetical protein
MFEHRSHGDAGHLFDQVFYHIIISFQGSILEIILMRSIETPLCLLS